MASQSQQNPPAQSSSGSGPDDAPPFRYTAKLADQIEVKWQGRWEAEGTFCQPNPGEPGFEPDRPKFYVLDMFPYPSGAGLHVGHPEGYTATDIVCRHKRMKGFNVLHPMGWDAFGLPAEQYAIATGVHPAITTRKAIDNFRRQLRRFGFSYDWSREFGTIDEGYYKWTQWIFLRMYDSWFDPERESPVYPDGKRRRGCARPIAELIAQLEGGDLRVGPEGELVHVGTAAANPLAAVGGGAEVAGLVRWHELDQKQRRAVIDGQRLAYLDQMTVNWCPALGTVLANDEVIDGRSERGGHPVLRKPLRQWQFRITSYAERLLDDLRLIDWPESTRAQQAEWIGRSEGAEIDFQVLDLGTPPVPGGRREVLERVDALFDANGLDALIPAGFVGRSPYPEGIYGPVADLVTRRRNLPHLRLSDATYFVTWKSIGGLPLSDSERQLVLDALTHFDGERCRVFAAVVMSNHVHWILRPFAGHTLDDIVTGVKQFTSREINKGRGVKGHVWDPECFDHIIRDVRYFNEFVEYVVSNPVEAGLVSRAADYPTTFVHVDVLGEKPAGDRRGTQEGTLRVFTTRPDTVFGATYMVVAPEHWLVQKALEEPAGDRRGTQELKAYVNAARNKSDVDRMAGAEKDKTGVFTGLHCVNPATGEKIPVWTADYVLMGYGTGAIMAVPAHDERDWEFAGKFGLPIVEVVAPVGDRRGADVRERHFSGDGVGVNSANAEVSLNGLGVAEAKKTIIAWLEKKGIGCGKVNYKLRDWVFSRQRYWGEPIPIVFDDHGNHYPIGESHLPVKLPELADYSPVESDEPQPLLAKATGWVRTTAEEAGVERGVLPPGTVVRRETNTMPGSAGSSWYFLRYCDPKNGGRLVSREADGYWMGGVGTPPVPGGMVLEQNPPGTGGVPTGVPRAVAGVDLYIGGSEHAVGHLLYARFWHKALFDLGEVCTPEPFGKLFHQGMITSYAYQRPDKTIVPMDEVKEVEDGKFVEAATGVALVPVVTKMSKRYKNVINPDEVIAQFGADTFRLYEMYMGPLEASKPWNTKDTVGCFRFLQRAWRMAVDERTGELKLASAAHPEVEKQLHRTIAKVDGDIPRLAFNTAIAALIEFVNLATGPGVTREQLGRFALILSPFAPHMAEELWAKLGHGESIAYQPFPCADPRMLVDAEVEMPVSIQGKVKHKVMVPTGADRSAIEKIAMSDPKVQELIAGKTVSKIIVVPGKMVNIVLG
jgi:leucyl-tRNA synthetase